MYSTLFNGLSFLLYTTCVANAFMNGGRLGSSLASFSSLRRNRNTFQTKSYFLSSPSVSSSRTRRINNNERFQFQFQFLQLKKASEDDYDYYANSNSNSNQSFNINDYYSSLSMEELRDIASQRGYDTFGMDRDGLETIARGWSPSMFKVPDQSKYQTVIVDDVSQRRQLSPQREQPEQKKDDIIVANKEQSLKAAFVGFCAGGVAVSPFTYVHNIFFPVEIITNQISQWEFDTVQGAVAAGAFAAVYRYFVKEEKDEALVSCMYALYACMHVFCISAFSEHVFFVFLEYAFSMY